MSDLDRQRIEIQGRIATLLALADRAENAQAGKESTFWTEMLRPLLEAEISGFRDLSISMDKEEFGKAQPRAMFAREILDQVAFWTTEAAAEARAEAERLNKVLEASKTAG